MKHLLYKEFRLSLHPTMYLFLLLAALLVIPSYPYYIAFMYICLGVFFTFLSGRESNDLFYTAMLPVRKRDVVTARALVIGIFELGMILISLPFAWLSLRISPTGHNAAGIDLNAAFYGLVFLMLGGFNLCFLPEFYRTGRKLTKPLIYGGGFVFLYIFAAEAAAQYIPSPVRDYLDTTDPAAFVSHLPVLLGGIALWAGLTTLAWYLSARRFERLDL